MAISCSKNDVIPNEKQPEQDQINTYVIQSISYDVPSALVEELLDRRPNLQYSNNTSIAQKVIINPQNLTERSLFKEDKSTRHTILDSVKLISVPSQINNGEITYGDKKWTYSPYQEEKNATLSLIDSVAIDPGKGLNASLTVIYEKITMPYTLILEETNTQDTIQITGKWSGIYPVNMRTSFTFQDL